MYVCGVVMKSSIFYDNSLQYNTCIANKIHGEAERAANPIGNGAGLQSSWPMAVNTLTAECSTNTAHYFIVEYLLLCSTSHHGVAHPHHVNPANSTENTYYLSKPPRCSPATRTPHRQGRCRTQVVSGEVTRSCPDSESLSCSTTPTMICRYCPPWHHATATCARYAGRGGRARWQSEKRFAGLHRLLTTYCVLCKE